jgi:hypothetical protein
MELLKDMSRRLADVFRQSTPLTRDGWPEGRDPFKPDTRICMPSGRVYNVQKNGSWKRNRREEVLLKDALRAQREESRC